MALRITSVIVTYNRIENLPKVLRGIRMQTIPSQVIIWDNGNNVIQEMDAWGEDILINSSRNFYSHARFLAAGLARTPYVFTQDDDMAITDPKLFEKLLATSKENPNDFIGWNGRLFYKDTNWDKPYSFPGKGFCGRKDMLVEMVNTGMSFFPVEVINQVDINPSELTEDEIKYGDDIWVSKQLQRKRITSYMEDAVEKLDEFEDRGVALSKQPQHMNIRDELCRRYFRCA